MLNILFAAAGEEPKNDWMTFLLIGLVVVMVVVVVVLPMFSRNKQKKEADEGKRFLRPGDKIKTVGGIVGTIIAINTISEAEKELVIETGIDDRKTTMVIDLNALYVIMQRGAESTAAIEQARQEREAAEAARLAEKMAKKNGGKANVAPVAPTNNVFPEAVETVSDETPDVTNNTSTKDE